MLPRGDEPARVLPHVFLGAKAHARDRELLARLQITHVLNVTPPKSLDPVAGVPNFFEKDKTLTYRRCPVFDNKAEDISGLLEGCVAFIEQAKYYGRILVHCNKGVSRSASVVVAYLMKTSGMSFERALAFVTDKRPVANPNASFQRQLKDFGEKLKREAAALAAKNRSGRVVGVRGPQGPSLPPKSEQTQEETKVKVSIGPQLPPKREDDGSSTNQSSSSEKVQAETKASIGPQLPPHLQKRKESEDRDAVEHGMDGEQEEQAAAAIIGPSFPPPSYKRRREAASVGSDAASPRIKCARSD